MPDVAIIMAIIHANPEIACDERFALRPSSFRGNVDKKLIIVTNPIFLIKL
jgi:hypothetical protein